MSELMLSDDILMQVEKPARYIGKEINSVVKRPESVDIRMAMCFPDVYEIGMSHLGLQILYDMFNGYEDVWCERVYSPWPDLDKIMREREIPLFGLESQEPVKYLDFLGITLQYEMCYTNILQVLDLSQIPLLAKDRTEDDPIVVGGGPCSYNPEPIFSPENRINSTITKRSTEKKPRIINDIRFLFCIFCQAISCSSSDSAACSMEVLPYPLFSIVS